MDLYEAEAFGTLFLTDNKTSAAWRIFIFTFSSAGLVLSAAALALLLLTAVLFSEWRQNYKNQLLIQFMLARFLYTFVRYIHDLRNVFNGCNRYDCIIYLDVLSMVYSEITLVVWMLIFSRQMYMSLVKVFDSDHHNIGTLSICAWTVPAATSLMLYLIFYVQTDKDTRYFIIYLLLIKWPVLIANAILLIIILRSILINNSKTENNMRIILVMIFLIFMFGIQQILIDFRKIHFVKFSDKYIVTSALFIGSNIATMFHCAFSILFWVFGNANTRKLWKLQDLRDKMKLSFSSFKLDAV